MGKGIRGVIGFRAKDVVEVTKLETGDYETTNEWYNRKLVIPVELVIDGSLSVVEI